MIREASKKKDGLKIQNISFSQGTIFNADLEKSSFDVIIAYAIIHLLKDSEKVIPRIHELLKPGGFFISTTACFKEKMTLKTRLEFTAFLFMNRIGIFPLHLNLYKASDPERLLSSRNFNIVTAEPMFNRMTFNFIVAKKH